VSEICDRCGAEMELWIGPAIRCATCNHVEQTVDKSEYLHPEEFFSWLERVIDRRVQKALVGRELP
jgi:predicted ATP-dependent serine protease